MGQAKPQQEVPEQLAALRLETSIHLEEKQL
jgi:hypothetical protein